MLENPTMSFDDFPSSEPLDQRFSVVLLDYPILFPLNPRNANDVISLCIPTPHLRLLGTNRLGFVGFVLAAEFPVKPTDPTGGNTCVEAMKRNMGLFQGKCETS